MAAATRAASENAAVRMGLPLHRGPHVAYSELVAERVGQIEGTWSGQKSRDPEGALSDALMRLSLLEQALRRWLLSLRRGATRLNRYDPLGSGRDFTELDAMADALWGATGAPELSPPSQAGLPFDDEG